VAKCHCTCRIFWDQNPRTCINLGLGCACHWAILVMTSKWCAYLFEHYKDVPVILKFASLLCSTRA